MAQAWSLPVLNAQEFIAGLRIDETVIAPTLQRPIGFYRAGRVTAAADFLHVVDRVWHAAGVGKG